LVPAQEICNETNEVKLNISTYNKSKVFFEKLFVDIQSSVHQTTKSEDYLQALSFLKLIAPYICHTAIIVTLLPSQYNPMTLALV